MVQLQRRKRFGRLTLVVITATALVNAVCLRLHRHYFGEAPQSQEHELLEDHLCADSTCLSRDITPKTRPSEVEVAYGETFLQVSKTQITIAEAEQSKELLALRKPTRFPLPPLPIQGAPTSARQSATRGVVITVEVLKCRTETFAPDGMCPSACPYFAQEAAGNKKPCFFQCVASSQCGSLDPSDDIADDNLKICRKCKVVGCNTCAPGKGDTCAKCDTGYSLSADGKACYSEYSRVWSTILAFVGVIGLFLVAWLLRLQFLPMSNADGLREGLAHRSSLKLRKPRGSAGEDPSSSDRALWPLTTNLHVKAQVGGPGLTLHMNFQLACIIWGCCVVVTWVIYTYCTSPEMLVLGLYAVSTPVELCSVTLRGREIQQRLIPTKVVYMVLMYVFTFIFNFVYALYQRHRFLAIDDEASMNDFAAMCKGLPEISGGERAEDAIKKSIEASTGETVVGVSICWAYKDIEDDVAAVLEDEVKLLEIPSVPLEAVDGESNQGLGNNLFGWVDGIFGFTGKMPIDVKEAQQKTNVEAMLKNMLSSDSAFIVFENESSRNKAVEAALKPEGISFQGCKLNLSRECCRPDTVSWTNFSVTNWEFYTKIAIGIVAIVVALVVWCLGFYLPFAYYQASFAKQGEEPGFTHGFIFSMLVVGGNQIMYFLCGDIADRVGFRFSDHKEAFYIALYTSACTLNLVVDMGMELYLAYYAQISSGAHTADGHMLADLTGYQDIFEAYVMQKGVGERLFAYCFPATFLIPFVMEPIFAIILPFFVCKALLAHHPECRGREAEKSLEFFVPFDMSRYGDLLLNLMLCVLIVFFPPGTFLKMMMALVICHTGVYFYDQYRILRCVPAFGYGSDIIERVVQICMGIPTAFLAAGIVFKGGCLQALPFCLQGANVGMAMALASVLTLALHVFLIKSVVPMFDNVWMNYQVSQTQYSEAAASSASTWFSENPVHCLRSKYVYMHEPPCMFNTRGKEHVMKKNEKCGVYFDGGDRFGAEEYD